MHVFVDLDGVLADFVSRALQSFGKGDGTTEEHIANIREQYPDLHPFVALETYLGMTSAEFWNGIAIRGSAFWSIMDSFKWSYEFWREINRVASEENVSILTAIPHSTAGSSAASGKLLWVRGELGASATKQVMLVPRNRKQLLAKGNILIDDMDTNCEEWEAAGGIAIKFPCLQFDGRHPTRQDRDQILDQIEKAIGQYRVG